MNFYQLYNLLNEYGQSLIQSLIQKFQQEVPTLNPTIIKSYIDRFEKIKNNLPEKDITKYSWKELENTVDSHQPKQRIKAGKLDPTVSDANLLYNQDKIRIYLGKDKKSCIRYGNGYSFCISARGENNMYAYYRIKSKGTPYFIFNDNLPKEDNRHLMVLFVYKHGTEQNAKRYSLTLASNSPEDETEYDEIEEIIRKYPWTKPITNFVDDKNKGTVDVETFEILEDFLSESLSSKLFSLRYHLSTSSEASYLVELLSNDNNFVKNFKKLQDLLNDNDKNVIAMSVVRKYTVGGKMEITVRKFDDYDTVDELKNDLITTTESINKSVFENDQLDYKDKIGLKDYIKTKKEIEKVFNSFYASSFTWDDLCVLTYPESNKENSYKDTFIIKLFSKRWIQQALKESPSINASAEAHKEYQSNLSWLKERTPEQMKMILDKIEKDDSFSKSHYSNFSLISAIVDKSFAYFKNLF